MKKVITIIIAIIIIVALVVVVKIQSDKNNAVNNVQVSENTGANSTKQLITKELAYEGVKNYCKKNYDWSIAEENPSIMYVTMGNETDSEYNVTFRSYTGSFVYFHVNKTTGITKMVESVPSEKIENEIGTIDLYDFIK